MNIKRVSAGFCFALGITAASFSVQAQNAICYNCPPEWANWGEMLKTIKADLGISIPGDNKNSGQAVAQIIAEKASPVADIAYLGINAGIAAGQQDLVEVAECAFVEVRGDFCGHDRFVCQC